MTEICPLAKVGVQYPWILDQMSTTAILSYHQGPYYRERDVRFESALDINEDCSCVVAFANI